MLYEVITRTHQGTEERLRLRRHLVHHGGDAQDEGDRITSYNVCYTQLLRNVQSFKHAVRDCQARLDQLVELSRRERLHVANHAPQGVAEKLPLTP